jgi:hypothetical protein
MKLTHKKLSMMIFKWMLAGNWITKLPPGCPPTEEAPRAMMFRANKPFLGEAEMSGIYDVARYKDDR